MDGLDIESSLLDENSSSRNARAEGKAAANPGFLKSWSLWKLNLVK
jgi:hypothetical protein